MDPKQLGKDPKSSSAKPFLDAIMSKPYLTQVVLAPHLYCPAVSALPHKPDLISQARMSCKRKARVVGKATAAGLPHALSFSISLGTCAS